jgi:muramoyltetrapeptide carboxypeptidase
MIKLKSYALQPGARIGVVAPSSPVNSTEAISEAISVLKNQGFELVLGETARPMDGYLAGTDLMRQTDLERMWFNKSIAAIWCLRGGYGSIRLLPQLYFQLLKTRPKILIGFSDITALELGLWSQIKLITFHGPVLTTLIESEFTRNQALRLLSGHLIDVLTRPEGAPEGANNSYYPIKTGKAHGKILGGNLATINSLIGTRFFPSFEGAILFLEEVNEADYRIDRMLTQLILTGALDSTAAIIIGRCIPVTGQSEADLIRVFTEKLIRLNCPSGYGFPIGHIKEQWTLPQGVMGEVNTDTGTLALLENPLLF